MTSLPDAEALRRLQQLWDQHRRTPFPAAQTDDPRFQEVALYESWLGGIAEATLAAGRLSAGHRRMLEQRRREGNRHLWAAAGELGEPTRSYVARLIAIEDLVSSMGPDNMAAR